ncbi:hypothetical protein [Agrobacterium vitis]|uniref:hypothetical protein n=1 Tax=Agrobacterium vitis TaxID=373 RepID=UPI0008DC1F80|nr:hypothetical protein [Agrobacterium vitis]MUO84017.1 hypothetical protein [Agrobacterium vitis]
MKLRDQLIEATSVYCSASGMSRSRLSTILLSGGMRLQQIQDGGDIGVSRFEQAIQWLSDNWPDDTPWPDGVYRPEPKPMEVVE